MFGFLFSLAKAGGKWMKWTSTDKEGLVGVNVGVNVSCAILLTLSLLCSGFF